MYPKVSLALVLLIVFTFACTKSYRLGQTNAFRIQAKKSEKMFYENTRLFGKLGAYETIMLKHGITPMEYEPSINKGPDK